jgi:hypothetical protein
MVPKFQVATACFSCSPHVLNSSKFTPILWRPLNYFTFQIIISTFIIILTSSLLFYPYQKDERVLPGNLPTIRCSFFPPPPKIKCLSLLPQHFSLLLLFCYPSELSPFRLQRFKEKSKVRRGNRDLPFERIEICREAFLNL